MTFKTIGLLYLQELFVDYGYHRGNNYTHFMENIDDQSEWYQKEFRNLPIKEANILFEDSDEYENK